MSKEKEEKDSGLVGVSGVYEVLSRLSRKGWAAAMTPGNTKGFDILASKQVGEKTIIRQIEVKTVSKKQPVNSDFWGKSLIWTMHKKHEEALAGVWYCFVNFEEEFDLHTGDPLPKGSQPRTSVYLATSQQVADFAKESHPKWLHNPEATRNHTDTAMRYFCLGFKNGTYKVESTLMAEDCHERWDLLEEEK